MYKKHWTTLLGFSLFLIAFVLMLREAWDSAWLTPAVKILFGIVIAGVMIVAGVQWMIRALRNAHAPKYQRMTGEIICGFGVSLLFATYAFAGVYYAIWTSVTVFSMMVATVVAVVWFAYRYALRMLMNVSLVGGIVAPLFLRPETDQMFALFLYMIVLNVGVFFVTVQKKWEELYIVSFLGTWTMYIVYVVHFVPIVIDLWETPVRYAIATFLFFSIAIAWTSWAMKRTFDGSNLIVGMLNGAVIVFVFIALSEHYVEEQYTQFILLFVGGVYAAVALAMVLVMRVRSVAFFVYGLSGILCIVAATTQFVRDNIQEMGRVIYLTTLLLFVPSLDVIVSAFIDPFVFFAQEYDLQYNFAVLWFVGGQLLAVPLAMVLVKRVRPVVFFVCGFIGILCIVAATTQFVRDSMYEAIILTLLWFGVAVVLHVLSRFFRIYWMDWLSRLVWFVVVYAWFRTTWDAPRGEWFGMYIPFLNTGALSWMLLAGLGFWFARNPVQLDNADRDLSLLDHVFAITSHLIVGGLLIVQVENVWEEYVLAISLQLTMSAVLGVYALLLFLWGAFVASRLYTIFGSVMLLLVAVKAIFFDLSEEGVFQKMIVLVVLGLISLAFTYVRTIAEKRQAGESAQ